MSHKVITVIGARPQFTKATPVCLALQEVAAWEHLIVHTGQHYDHNMSQIFFDEMGIPEPYTNLNVGSGSHGRQTALIMMAFEELVLELKPDLVIVYGDTNSTLATTLVATKLHIPVAHIEAGLRSFNRTMPEEHNRVLTDHSSDILFCPTQTAVDNLRHEGITQGVHMVGDTMYDAVLHFGALARQKSNILNTLDLDPQTYYLATVHRPANTDYPNALQSIFEAFHQLDHPVIVPLHPRTVPKLQQYAILVDPDQVRIIEPTGYLDTLLLLENAVGLLTDSGGMQKEAYFLQTPCITLREETEWVETLNGQWNILVGANPQKIIHATRQRFRSVRSHQQGYFGDGNATAKIVKVLTEL